MSDEFEARNALLKGTIIASFGSNIGLFNLIFKPIVFNAKQIKSPKWAASVFFRLLNVLILLLKLLSLNNEFKYKKLCIHV